MGKLYSLLSDTPQVIIMYKKPLLFNPKYILPLNNLGFIYFNLKNYHEALIFFKQLSLQDFPGNSAFANMGACYQMLNDVPNSLLNYEKSLAKETITQNIINNLITLYRAIGAQQMLLSIAQCYGKLHAI